MREKDSLRKKLTISRGAKVRAGWGKKRQEVEIKNKEEEKKAGR